MLEFEPRFFVFLVLAAFLTAIFARYIYVQIRKKRARKIWKKHFCDKEIYSLEEVAEVFHLSAEHFIKLISILEKYGHFEQFNKFGVTMRKDFYSSYELKTLIELLVKKEKLKNTIY